MDKEKLMNLVNTDFDKFQLEVKRIYKEEYVIKLEQQVKKQKEVIDKIFSRITLWKMEDITMDSNRVLDDLLDILKDVSE